jgi:hypothetical protein
MAVEAAARAVEQIEDEFQAPVLPKPPEIPLEAVRYVACLADFIVPGDKAQLRGLGARAGGYRVGLNDIGGCPTMWRRKGMLLRGIFTSLEKTVVTTHADEKHDKGPVEDAVPVGERIKYPASDITYLTDGDFYQMGVTELSVLRGHEWTDGLAKELNRHFFPDINLWRAGDKPFPTLLSVYEDLIGSAAVLTDEHAVTQGELLDSIRRSRIWMIDHIEANRAIIQSTRNVNMGGASFKWSDKSRLFAAQLDVVLENERDVAPAPQAVTPVVDERYVSAIEKQNELKERELDMLSKPIEPAFVPPPDTAKCSAITKTGEQCQRDIVANGRCALSAHAISDPVIIPMTEE